MKPDIAAVATLEGREIDRAVHEHVMGGEHRIGKATIQVFPAPHYSDENTAFFSLIAKLREQGWMHVDIFGGFYDTEEVWRVTISCQRGPCELHGTTEEDAHSVSARGATLPIALARAALLTTYPHNEGKAQS